MTFIYCVNQLAHNLSGSCKRYVSFVFTQHTTNRFINPAESVPFFSYQRSVKQSSTHHTAQIASVAK